LEKSPLVSIIIPNYNHSQYLTKRLKSVFNQTYVNFEVILLDDCSTDGSMELLMKYAKHPKVSNCIFNERNSGNTFAQWNRGISLAKGKYIWIAESDDYCEKDFLEKLIAVGIKYPEIALCYCQSHKVNSQNEVTGNWIDQTQNFMNSPFYNDFKMKGIDFIEQFLIYKNVIPNVSAVLFKKEAFIKIHPLFFSQEMKYNADWFYYFLILSNSNIAFLSESLNYFRYHGKSVIAKGREKSVWRGFDMEIKTRKRIIKLLKDRQLENWEIIRKKDHMLKRELNYLILKSLIRNKQIRAVFYLILYPKFLWRLIKNEKARI